jgi:hypothetical protein
MDWEHSSLSGSEQAMKFLLPQGIGDSVWALHKIQSVANGKPIEVCLNCSEASHIQTRALEFVQRFSFVDRASMLVVSIHPSDNCVDTDGRYVYLPDGWSDCCGDRYFVMMPNAPLERGVRLEDWLPEYKIDWNTSQKFRFESSEEEFAEDLLADIGPYCTFYPGPLVGNFGNGHNRGALWTAEDWAKLGKFCQEKLGLKIVVLGAEYDSPFYDYWVDTEAKKHCEEPWVSFVGKLGIGATFAAVKRSRFTISYQSGIGIFSSYLGIPTGIFWRAKGDSISPDLYISFEESMSSAWTRPDMLASGKHLPLIYGRHRLEYICEEILKRGW